MPKAEGETAQKTKNGAVELLRILAITCILFHHYQQLTGVYYPEGLNFYNGRFPFQYLVELFFLLSGFLAARYIPQIVAGLRFVPFIAGRIRRLFPGMVLSVFVCYVLMYIYYRQYGNYWMDIPINKGRLLVTMLGMGSGWFVSGTQINGPTWYVSVLFLCLILFYVLTMRENKNGIPIWCCYLFMVLLGTAVWIFISKAEDKTALIPFFDIYACRGYYAFFWGLLVAEIAKKKNVLRIAVIWAAAAAGLLVVYLVWPGPFLTTINLFLALAVYPPFLLLLTSEKVHEKTKKWKPVLFFGRMSYSVYLWHVPFFLGVFQFLLWKNIYVDLQKPVSMIAYAVMAWIAGIAAYYLLEMPFRKIVGQIVDFGKGRLRKRGKNDN